MRILFVTSRTSPGAEISYPLIKWRRDLRKAGLTFEILHELPQRAQAKADVIMLCSPFWRERFKTNGEFMKAADLLLVNDFERGYELAQKVIFFETADSTASSHLPHLQNVDLMLKWQILKDKNYYCSAEYKKKPRVWVDGPQKPRLTARPCDLPRLGLGWNLAYRNYSLFRRGARHLHWKGITWNTRYTPVQKDRPLLTFFRGGLDGSRQTHRGAAISKLLELRRRDIVLGDPVPRYRFLKEIKSAKATVSPFGHGEICFRDMEAFIHGSIVIKPEMDHVETFPNLYVPNVTYVPVNWDFSDLSHALQGISNDYRSFSKIAEAGQELYREYTETPGRFCGHIESIMNRLFS